MKLGAAFPSTEVSGNPDDVRQFVRAIEDLGYDHIMVPDHVVKPSLEDRDPPVVGPYTEKSSFHDPFVLFSFMAALTDRLHFVSGILVLPQRQTGLVAQQAADVDLLSRERLRLGVGVGWNPIEYAAMGQDFRTRGRRMEEQIGLLRRLWTEPLVQFRGEFDHIDRAATNPRPRRSIPIWLGGQSEPAYERAARIADGFIHANGKGAAAGMERVRHHLKVQNRDEASFGSELLTQFAKDVPETAQKLVEWHNLGGTHGSATSTSKGLGNSMEAHIAYFAEVKHRFNQG